MSDLRWCNVKNHLRIFLNTNVGLSFAGWCEFTYFLKRLNLKFHYVVLPRYFLP